MTASFTATAFTPMGFRKTRIFGSHGSIEGDGVRLTVEDFVSGTREVIETDEGEEVSLAGDHGGADQALTDAFVAALAADDPSPLLSDARTSLASHRLVWAAERARRTGTVVSLADDESPVSLRSTPIAPAESP
ncbi:hypothetical protein GCM10029978_015560 [Actinoallomurus acanthiterrae]